MLVYFSIGLFSFFGFLAGHVLASSALLGLMVLINGINAAYYFFYSYRYPEYTQRPVRLPSGGEAKATAAPHSLEVQTALARLKTCMEVSGTYRDPDLTVQSLSNTLGLSPTAFRQQNARAAP